MSDEMRRIPVMQMLMRPIKTENNMSKQDQFRSLRRLYRLSMKLPVMTDRAIEMRFAAVDAMRQFTDKWDCCEPLRGGHVGGTFVIRKHPRLWIKRPFVAAACTKWIAAQDAPKGVESDADYERDDDEVDTYHARDCSIPELTAEVERLSEGNKRLRAVLHDLLNATEPTYDNRHEIQAAKDALEEEV